MPQLDGGEQSTLTIDVSVGEQIVIGDCFAVELLAKSGRNARLRLIAPRSVKIERANPLKVAPSMAT